MKSEITNNKVFIDKLHHRNSVEASEDFNFLTSVMPPRRKWVKLNEIERVKYQDSVKRNIHSLELTLAREEKSVNHDTWFLKLHSYVDSLINRFNDNNYQITQPVLKAMIKERKDNTHIYRPISNFTINDKILISLVNKYFTDIFEELFKDLNCSFAFRSTKNSQNITHHDCVLKISEYLRERPDQKIYVVECDIKKFFDCVNHEMLNDQWEMCEIALLEKGIEISQLAKKFFFEYLSKYSFKKDVYSKNAISQWFIDNKLIPGIFKWEESELISKYYPDGVPNNIGVPQGGALSCLIANIYMHHVDSKILDNSLFKGDSELLYVRFCDDMVILHTNREKCAQALKLYIDGIKELKLLYHESPEERIAYTKKFWNAKAKPIYSLDFKNNEDISIVPWLAFVGYQIRRDGLIRIRKMSIVKEKKKIIAERQRILKSLGAYKKGIHYQKIVENIKIPPKNIVFRLQSRYISMSVGKVGLKMPRILQDGKIIKTKEHRHQSLCWTNGFKLLQNNPIISKQLKDLDRHRHSNLRKLSKYFLHLNRITGKTIGESLNKGNENDIKFFGNPFSYHQYLNRNTVKKDKQ